MRVGAMLAHTRAMVAAATYAFIARKTVAGLYDHTTARHLRIAAESRGDSLQGYDEGRSARFGGTLPELYDAGDRTYVSMEIEGQSAKGHDRGSATSYTSTVTDAVVQVYDHGAQAWFAFTVQTA